MTECDHTDTRRLGTDPETNSDSWPVIFDDKPKNGFRQTCECMECGEKVHLLYRQEEIIEDDGEVIWERD